MVAPAISGHGPDGIPPEQALISFVFIDGNTSLSRIQESRIAFDDARCRTIYEQMQAMSQADKPLELDVVAEELKTRGKLDEAGGWAFLNEISRVMPTTASFRYYLDKARTQTLLRDLSRTATSIVQSCREYSGEDIDSFVDESERKVFAITQTRVSDKTQHAKPIVEKALSVIQTMISRKGEMGGLRTGFHDLDRYLWGMKPSEVIIIAGRPSQGKAQPLDAKVLTPLGFVPMGSIEVGDYVIGSTGLPVRVSGVFPQGKKKIVRVVVSDGSSTRCCEEHLWLTETRNERRFTTQGPSVKTTAQIRETLRRQDGGYRNHALPSSGLVEFAPSGHPLPLHPWLLGALLGDGSLSKASLLFSKPEADVQQKLISLLPVEDTGTVVGMDVRIKRKVRLMHVGSETKKAIAMMGLCVDSIGKFIPPQYLMASPEARLELLRGLLDTDGCCNSTTIEFSTSSPQLMDGVQWLVRSLGGQCTRASRITKYTYKGEKKDGARSYRGNIWFSNGIVPVSSEKHLRKFNMSKVRHVHRSIVDIEDAGEAECQCISVEAVDGLYVTDDFIVTHNTALGMNIVESVILPTKGKPSPAMVFSLEMSGSQLMQRMIASRARVNMNLLRDGLLSKNGEEAMRLVMASDELARAPLYIDDSSTLTVSHIRARARRQHAKTPLGCVVVDYLQLIAPSKSEVNREQQVAEASRGLKALAKELDVPVIVLSQLNRAPANGDRRPKLTDLRESGAIEQDADVVLMLARPKDADEDHQVAADTMDLIIAKNRNGPVGEITLSFLRDLVRFDNYTR